VAPGVAPSLLLRNCIAGPSFSNALSGRYRKDCPCSSRHASACGSARRGEVVKEPSRSRSLPARERAAGVHDLQEQLPPALGLHAALYDGSLRPHAWGESYPRSTDRPAFEPRQDQANIPLVRERSAGKGTGLKTNEHPRVFASHLAWFAMCSGCGRTYGPEASVWFGQGRLCGRHSEPALGLTGNRHLAASRRCHHCRQPRTETSQDQKTMSPQDARRLRPITGILPRCQDPSRCFS